MNLFIKLIFLYLVLVVIWFLLHGNTFNFLIYNNLSLATPEMNLSAANNQIKSKVRQYITSTNFSLQSRSRMKASEFPHSSGFRITNNILGVTESFLTLWVRNDKFRCKKGVKEKRRSRFSFTPCLNNAVSFRTPVRNLSP